MLHPDHVSFKNLVCGCFTLCASLVFSQTAMLAEFKALPAFPASAADAFSKSKTVNSEGHYTYQSHSDAIGNYEQKIQADNKPYQDIIMAKGVAGIPTGQAAANDFSDLSSPETQARLAKMSQDEKIKFAMEIQQRMNSNKNIQSANQQTKPGPLTGLVLKLNTSCQKLLDTLPVFSKAPAVLNYDKCNFNCRDDDNVCYTKMQACNRATAQTYYTAEVGRYNNFIKNIPAAFNTKKAAFEKDLKEFDEQSKKYSKADIAVECSNVFGMLLRCAAVIDNYEKQGATILVEAKDNPYCGKDF